MAFTATLSATLNVQVTNAGVPNYNFAANYRPTNSIYGSGTSAQQIDSAFQSQVSASTGGVSLNIQNGSQVQLNGSPLALARVTSIIIRNTDGSHSVTLSGNWITSVFGAAQTLAPGARLLKDDISAAALAVTASSADTITFTSSAGTAVCEVAICGRSV